MTFPKIELHVRFEGTMRAPTPLEVARRNGVAAPADSVEGLASLHEFRDFAHFIDAWALTTGALRTDRDFRQVVVDCAAEAASQLTARGTVMDVCPTSNAATREELRTTGQNAAWPPAPVLAGGSS